MPSPPPPPGPRPTSVPPRALSDVVTMLSGAVTGADPAPVRVTGLTHDSRAVRPGDLYVARPGERTHGAAHVRAALAAGAVAVLTDPQGARLAGPVDVPVVVVPDPRSVLGRVAAWVYGDPSRHLLVAGVTGTNGKTTTSYLLEAGLRAAGHRTGLVGTVQTRVGDDALDSVRTTPEAPDLQALLALMRERDVTAVAMEVSSHALALGRVAGTRFAVAVFTNLSQDHLDFHADMEDYFAAKARLFTPDYAERAVVDVDDAYGARLARQATVPVATLGEGGDWRVGRVERGPAGTAFTLVARDGEQLRGATRLLGSFNARNAMLALLGLREVGAPRDAAMRGVGGLAAVPGRMERVEAGQPFLAVVDYAHTPQAVVLLLDTLRELTTGRLVVVLGCGGDRDRGKRPLMGAAAARGADLAVLTSDNPRSEDPLAILAAMSEGVATVPEPQRAQVLVEPDRRAAITLAAARCRRGDTLVVAGKGHEQGQEYAEQVVPFDDRVVLREALAAAGSAA